MGGRGAISRVAILTTLLRVLIALLITTHEPSRREARWS